MDMVKKMLGIKDILRGFGQAAAAVVLYLPVVAGIITPMMWLLPAWYLSWSFAAYIFPFGDLWHGFIIVQYDTILVAFSRVTSLLLVCVGSALFLGGLIEMSRIRKAPENCLITSGPYARVRHPQHLGIIMILLSVVLKPNIYSQYWIGVRPGDILSWSLMALILVVTADYEEAKLERLFGEDYSDYSRRVPFMLPVKVESRVHWPQGLARGRPLRYVAIFLAFYALVVSMLLVTSLLPLIFTR